MTGTSPTTHWPSSVFVPRNYTNYKATKRGIAKFLHDVVDNIWYNNLEDAKTLYTKVTTLEIMVHLDANSRGLHATDMISLCSNMTQYYLQADGIPQFIVMMEDVQKKAKQAGMPITVVKLVMMALAAVLAAQHFLQEVDDLDGLPAINGTWRAWKAAFCLANLKRQRQLQVSGVGGPLGSAHAVLPTPAATIDWLGIVLNNLALAVANNTIVLQQLAASNLALSTLVTTLTAANKKLAEALAKAKLTSPPAATPEASVVYQHTFPQQLLLDAWPSMQPASHKHDLRQQSHGSQRHSICLQHNGWQQHQQGLEHSHLTVWDGKCSLLQRFQFV
jgi:hypothetical protein